MRKERGNGCQRTEGDKGRVGKKDGETGWRERRKEERKRNVIIRNVVIKCNNKCNNK